MGRPGVLGRRRGEGRNLTQLLESHWEASTAPRDSCLLTPGSHFPTPAQEASWLWGTEQESGRAALIRSLSARDRRLIAPLLARRAWPGGCAHGGVCVRARARARARACVCVLTCGAESGLGLKGGSREAAGAGGGLHKISLRVLSLVLSGVQQRGVLNKH